MDKKTTKHLLKALESSGGKDTKHRIMTEGMHKGDAALGHSGMMPETLKLIANRKIRDGEAEEFDYVVKDAPNSLLEQVFNDNPHRYEEYTDRLANQVIESSKGNLEDTYTRWVHGQSLPDGRVKNIQEKFPGIAKKVDQRIFENKLSSQPQEFIDTLPKSKVKDQLYSKIKNALKGK